MKKTVLVIYGDRRRLITFEDNDPMRSYQNFIAKFDSLVLDDGQFMGKKGSNPLFSYYNDEFQSFVDLYKGCEVPAGVKLNLTFYDPSEASTSTIDSNKQVK
jgi:hypothetical protein